MQLAQLHHSRLFCFFILWVGSLEITPWNSPAQFIRSENAQERNRIALLPPVVAFQVKTVGFSPPSHLTSSHRSDTDTIFVISYSKSLLCAMRVTGFRQGAKYGTVSELAWMKVTELKHPVSRRLTQPPVRLCVSPVWRSPASFNEHHFCRAGVRHPLVQTPVLDILDKLVLRHIFSLDPLMSLPAWEIACKNEHKGCGGVFEEGIFEVRRQASSQRSPRGEISRRWYEAY